MKTKVIFEEQNEEYMQYLINRELDMELEKVLYLSLLEKGFLNKNQYEKCVDKL